MIPNEGGSSPSSPRSWTTAGAASVCTPPPPSPSWALTALGPVPDDPAARPAWQQKTVAIGACRELAPPILARAADRDLEPEADGWPADH